MGADQERVVLAFLAFTGGREIDVDGMVGLLSDNISYEPFVPSTVRVGRDAVRAELEHQRSTSTGLLPGSEIRNVASGDVAVFVERIEMTEMGGKPLRLYITGVFEVHDGKIVAWRDYFDIADVASQLGIDASDIPR